MMINIQPQNQQNESDQFGLFAGQNPVPLKSTSFIGQLKGMMTRMTMELVFENGEIEFIEAVYTFPIPDGAVFLGLQFEMGGAVYKSVVMERRQATEAYEESVTDGNAAILVEEVSVNVYSLQVGNIPPETEVRIEYQYAILHEWRDGLLRWRLPTVLAPRYGQSGLASHHEPEVDLFTEHNFKFELLVEGYLSELTGSSPTHQLKFMRDSRGLKLTLGYGQDALNRDLVIHFEQDDCRTNEVVSVLWDRDLNNEYCALLSLCLPEGNDYAQEPKTIKILIDCSGSMAGESIQQARIALRQIMQEIRPEDKVMVWKFGSSIEKIHKKAIPLNKVNEGIYHRIQADLGGTELFGAMTKMASQSNYFSENVGDIFLITDGEVWNDDNAYNKLIGALGNKQRVFSVGVGRAVSTEILNRLAQTTGGAVELVTPDEQMASRVTSHFKRIYAAEIKRLNINWPILSKYEDKYPVIFSGDTAYIGARFKQKPEGEITINATYATGETVVWICIFNDLPYDTKESEATSVLARTIAIKQMTGADKDDSLKLAMDYQLLSEQTACYAEIKLAENMQSDGQPAIRKVPGMLAAGYGGLYEYDNFDLCDSFSDSGSEYLEVPAFLRRQADTYDDIPVLDNLDDQKDDLIDLNLILSLVEKFYNQHNRLPLNRKELFQCGLDEFQIDKYLCLSPAADKYACLSPTDDEIAHAIALFLYEQLPFSSELLSKNFSREIRVAAKLKEGK